MRVSYQLTMPNVGSWNGKWTGAGRPYFLIRGYAGEKRKRILEIMDGQTSKSFYYNFGDGWGASIRMEIVYAKEANKRMKMSAGFCGYEWMVDSIIKLGKIDSKFDKVETA